MGFVMSSAEIMIALSQVGEAIVLERVMIQPRYRQLAIIRKQIYRTRKLNSYALVDGTIRYAL